MIIQDPNFYAIAVPAVLLLGLSKSGFLTGFGSVVTPMLALTMTVPQAAAIMLPLLCAMDAIGVQKLWRERDATMLRWLVPAGLVGMAVGLLLFRAMSPQAVAGVVGVMTLAFLAQRRLLPRWNATQGHRGWGRLMAATSGFTSFVAHAGGPPIMTYILPLKMSPISMTATMAVFFAVMNASKWVPYAWLGLFDTRLMLTSLVLLPLAPLGVWMGIWLTRRISAARFYLVADIGMLITGVKLVADAMK